MEVPREDQVAAARFEDSQGRGAAVDERRAGVLGRWNKRMVGDENLARGRRLPTNRRLANARSAPARCGHLSSGLNGPCSRRATASSSVVEAGLQFRGDVTTVVVERRQPAGQEIVERNVVIPRHDQLRQANMAEESLGRRELRRTAARCVRSPLTTSRSADWRSTLPQQSSAIRGSLGAEVEVGEVDDGSHAGSRTERALGMIS